MISKGKIHHVRLLSDRYQGNLIRYRAALTACGFMWTHIQTRTTHSWARVTCANCKRARKVTQ